MSPTTHDAAAFVRSRLRGHAPRVTQDEMRELVEDLKATLGRTLTAADVADVVEAFREVTDAPVQAAA